MIPPPPLHTPTFPLLFPVLPPLPVPVIITTFPRPPPSPSPVSSPPSLPLSSFSVSSTSRSSPPLQAGSPGCNALQTVVTSDARLAALQQEAQILEEDAEAPSSGAHDETTSGREGGDDSGSSPHPPPPPSSPLSSMSALRKEIGELSLEEKVERLEEVYEGLDVLVR